MNPLLLHLDRFSVRALNRNILPEEKQLLDFLLEREGLFLHLFSRRRTRAVWFLFDLLAFRVKNEPHHSLNYPGDAR